MLLPRVTGVLAVLSLSAVVSAQAPPAKPRTVPRKPPVAAKAAAKPPAAAPVSPPPPAPATDVQLRTRYVTGAQVSENQTYISGTRQRFEFPGITMITQCDLQRSLQLHEATKRYLVSAAAAPVAVAAEDPVGGELAAQFAAVSTTGMSPAARPKGGVITETITLTDTGERKQIFGLEARHIKTVVVRQPGDGACEKQVTTIETDAWYADLPEHASCAAASTSAPPLADKQACTDQVITRNAGSGTPGFTLSSLMTTTIADASDKDAEKEVSTMSMEVIELKVTSLDKALFDLPPGYTEVQDYASLLPSLAQGGSLADAVFGSIADGTSAVAPKNDGVIRIGVVTPGNTSGKEMPDSRLVSSLLAGFTKAPFEALALSGATPADLDRDAAGKACDYVLVSDIAELKTSKPNRVGGMLKRVSGDVSAPTEIHEVRIDYKLYAVGDHAKPRISESVKASSGGGFGIGSALRVAAFAGQMYLTVGMGGGMMGMMGPAGSFGGLGGGLLAGRMNPGMGAAMSIMSAGSGMATAGVHGGLTGMPGMPDVSGEKITATVQDGLSKAARKVAEELKKRKSSAVAAKK